MTPTSNIGAASPGSKGGTIAPIAPDNSGADPALASQAQGLGPSGFDRGEGHDCDICGTKCPKYWTRCGECRLRIKLENAAEIEDDGGPYFEFGGDRYYQDIGTAAEDGVEWVAPCTKTFPRINGWSVLENLLDDMHEDASTDDLDGVEEFLAAVDVFNKIQSTASYWADEKRKIRVTVQS